MKNCNEFFFKSFYDKRGSLVAIEGGQDVPFNIERLYYITDVPQGMERGAHSHKDLEQVLICLNGSVKIRVESDKKKVFTLENPNQALYLGPMVWREMYDFSEHSVLLVLASHHYEPDDYIKDYNMYKLIAKQFFALT